jgi:hypothetical protein
MKDLQLNERLELYQWMREYFRTIPLEDIYRPEILAAMRADGLTDEGIRKLILGDDEIVRMEED